MKRLAAWLVLGSLFLLAAWQGWARLDTGRSANRTTSESSRPLLPGDTVRFALVGMDGEPREPPQGCWQAILMSPTCWGCIRLAEDVYGGGGPSAPVLWISNGDSSRAADFTERTGVPPGDLVLLAGQSWRGLGVRATPTRLILEGEQVRDLALVEPPADSAALARECLS